MPRIGKKTKTWQCRTINRQVIVSKLSLCKAVIAHFRPVFLYVKMSMDDFVHRSQGERASLLV